LLIGLRILGVFILFVLSFGIYISGVFTDYKAYKDYCSGYIPLLKEYFETHSSYPDNLNVFEERP